MPYEIRVFNMTIISRDYSDQLQEYQDQCFTMLTELGKALEFLQEMKRRHQFVSQRTGALHQACEQLVEEEVCTLYTGCTSVHIYDA